MTDLDPVTFDTGFLVLFRGDAECTRFQEYIPEVGDEGDDAFDVLLLSDTCGIICLNRWHEFNVIEELHAYLEREHACTTVHVAVPITCRGGAQAMRWLCVAFGWDNLTLHAALARPTAGAVETMYDDEPKLVAEGPEAPV